jgi:hypothetical protein
MFMFFVLIVCNSMMKFADWDIRDTNATAPHEIIACM